MCKIVHYLSVFVLLVLLVGCTEAVPAVQTAESSPNSQEYTETQAEPTQEEPQVKQITVRDVNGHEVLFELNGSSAADALLAQLPLEIEADNFSSNEKIFYPPQSLALENTPLAEGGAGTLAYYAPWGNVVMFYGDYRANGELYMLGSVISGAEQIELLSGVLTVTETKS